MPKSHKVATRNLLNGKERELKLKHKQQHSTDKKRERREKWTQRLTHFYDKPVPPKVIEMDMSAMEDVLLSIPVESNSKYDNINVIVDYKIAAIKSTLQSKRPISQKALRKSNLSEMIRMREVMKLGVFKANPLDTIQCHLKYTIDAQMKELDSLKK